MTGRHVKRMLQEFKFHNFTPGGTGPAVAGGACYFCETLGLELTQLLKKSLSVYFSVNPLCATVIAVS